MIITTTDYDHRANIHTIARDHAERQAFIMVDVDLEPIANATYIGNIRGLNIPFI